MHHTNLHNLTPIETIIAFAALFLVLYIYFLPTITAIKRNSPYKTACHHRQRLVRCYASRLDISPCSRKQGIAARCDRLQLSAIAATLIPNGASKTLKRKNNIRSTGLNALTVF
jgi:uncharacterized protein YqhQ